MFAFVLSVNGQTAKVIALTPDETKEAKSIAEARAELDKREVALRAQIDVRYLHTKEPQGNVITTHTFADGDWYYVRSGWENGFLFSDDWKFIVPKQSTLSGDVTTHPICPFSNNISW
jgi:hypothetical protein